MIMYFKYLNKIMFNILYCLCPFSIGDLNMPVNELIRLVRLYSSQWEQKSTALKKLHQDYESKKSQVNIAIKRLQMIDGQVIMEKEGCWCWCLYIYLTI